MSAIDPGLTCMELDDKFVATTTEAIPPSNRKRILQSFPLRLPRTMRVEAIELACCEDISLNQLIVQALAEKITRLQHSLSPREILPKPRPD